MLPIEFPPRLQRIHTRDLEIDMRRMMGCQKIRMHSYEDVATSQRSVTVNRHTVSTISW
jgi:hypothetical protein